MPRDDESADRTVKLVEEILGSAAQHGSDSEPEHEIGDLQDALRAAWTKLSPQDRQEVFTRLDLWDDPIRSGTIRGRGPTKHRACVGAAPRPPMTRRSDGHRPLPAPSRWTAGGRRSDDLTPHVRHAGAVRIDWKSDQNG